MILRKTSDAVIALAGFVVLVVGLRFAGPVIVPVLLAACMAAASAPIALWFKRRGAPSWMGPVAAVLLDLTIVALVVVLIVASMDEFQAKLPDYTQKLTTATFQLSSWLGHRGIFISADALYKLADPASLMPYVGTTLSSLAAWVSEIVLVLLITFFALFEISTLREKIAGFGANPERTISQISSVVHEVQRYLVVKTVLSLLTGAVVGILLALLGIDFTVLLAVGAFFLNFIPNLGSILAAVPAITVALVQYGPGPALTVTIGYIAVHLVVGNIVEPRVLGRTMGLSPLVVLLSMIFWGWLWGPAGALLSVPLTMIVKIVLSKNEELRWVSVILGPPAKSSTLGTTGAALLQRLSKAPRSRET